MITIWKFELNIEDDIEIEVPIGAKILTFDMQHGTPCLWCMVNTENKKEKRYFRLAGTGHDITDEVGIAYIGTIQMHNGDLISHLFERLHGK